MRGYYLHPFDVTSARAHATQIMQTAAAVGKRLPLSIVVPRLGRDVSAGELGRVHSLISVPPVVLLARFWDLNLLTFALFNLPASWFVLRKKLVGDVSFLYFRSSYLAPTALVARAFGIPYYYESHRRPLSASERCRDYVMSRFATGIIVISEYMKEWYVGYGKPLLVAHDAVSLARFGRAPDKAKARRELGYGKDEPICVYAGTVSTLKGLDTLVAAARLAPDIGFLLAGIIAPEFRGAVLPTNVKLLGTLSQERVPALLAAADVLVLPHPKSEYSQSPMKLFEYMASGIPIVASDIPPIAEVLNDKNAFLVEPGRPEVLADSIRHSFAHRADAAARAARAREDVGAHTWDVRGESIAEFISSTLPG